MTSEILCFISYARATQEKRLARELHDRLKAEKGLDVWLDDQEIAGGGLIEGIVQGLTEADCVICLISPEYVQRRFPMAELEAALNDHLDSGKPIFPIAIRHFDAVDRRRRTLALRGLHHYPYENLIDLDGEINHEELEKLIFELTKKIQISSKLEPGNLVKESVYEEEFGFSVASYLNHIDSQLESERILDFCVPLNGRLEKNNRFVDVWSYLQAWLSNENQPHLAILGDYGTGKSWLCLRLAGELSQQVRETGSERKIPLLLNLKSFERGMALETLISRTLGREYGLTTLDLPKIKRALHSRRLILILDGLDEMAREIGQRDALVQFARLGLPPSAKVLITCRTHYFLSNAEQRDVLNPGRAKLLRSVADFEILHLSLLDRTNVEKAISLRMQGDDVESLSAFVEKTYNLSELCSRPVLLDLVCRSQDQLKELKYEITSADLYEAYIEEWIGRELHSGRLEVEPEKILRLLEGLAEDLFHKNSIWVSDEEFNGLVDALYPESSLTEDVRRALVRQLATSALLRRSRLTGWEFAHRSFQEYLYAKRFFRWERETGAQGDLPVTHVPAWQFISQVALREWNEEKALEWIEERVRKEEEPSLCRTTLRAASAFWLIKRGKAKHVSTSLQGIMLDWVDLRGVDLSDLNLAGSDFNCSDLRGANLQRCDLRGSILTDTNFSSADLTDADLGYTNCTGAIFEGTETSGVRWDGAQRDHRRLTFALSSPSEEPSESQESNEESSED